MKKKGLLKCAALICALLMIVSMTACGSKKPEDLLVGTWVSTRDEIVVFEEDGSCTAPFTYNAGWWESADQYVVKEDGTLVLRSEAGHAGGNYKRADTEEEARKDDYKYFVSKDTLIIDGETYTRSK